MSTTPETDQQQPQQQLESTPSQITTATTPPPPPPSSSAASSSKISLLLKPVGDVPQLKTTKFLADGSHTVSWVITFLQKALKLEPSESIYIFVSQSFSPSPDHTLSNLHQCFAASSSSNSNLVLHYAKTCAWG